MSRGCPLERWTVEGVVAGGWPIRRGLGMENANLGS
jgi:hypothetical protein